MQVAGSDTGKKEIAMSKEVYNEGDLVEAVKGELVHRERVAKWMGLSGNENRLYLPELKGGPFLDRMEERGFTITVTEKAKPQLPTEPGIYVSWVNAPSPTIVHLTKSSGWVDANDENYLGVNELAKLMPLTRLAPVAEVLDRIRAASCVRDDGRGKDVFDLDEADFAIVAASYGVTK